MNLHSGKAKKQLNLKNEKNRDPKKNENMKIQYDSKK